MNTSEQLPTKHRVGATSLKATLKKPAVCTAPHVLPRLVTALLLTLLVPTAKQSLS